MTPRSTSLQTIDENEILARFGLVPHVEDLPKIRALLQTEAVDKNRDSNEPLKTLYIQQFSAGEPSDSLLIQSQDVLIRCRCYIDTQLVCGAGIERTKAFLLDCREPEAEKLLDHLESCISAGDFESFTPARHLEFYREYYGLSS